jgi:hypothetical protein
MRIVCRLAIVATPLALGHAAAATDLPESGELVCLRAAVGECDYRDRMSGLLLRWPNDWPVRRLRIVTESGPRARARQLDAIRWIAIEYVPDDSDQPQVSLFRVAVLRRLEWLRLSAQPVPTGAVEVAADEQHFAVASLEATNPYPPGSRDADIFDALMPGFEQISRMLSFPEAPVPAPSRDGSRPAR